MNNLLDAKWLKRLAAYSHLYVGYSGGLDSTVLLESLATCPQLKNKITALHVHHGLSPQAQSWLVHCQHNCQRLDLNFAAHHVHIQPGSNLEERARAARYAIFKRYIQSHDQALLLAHHQNDQGETLLLNLFRGAGLEGLCAMPEERVYEKGVLLRPFLQYPRETLLQFAKMHALEWVEDEMNASDAWSRTYLRQHILPQIITKWPRALANLATTARHCQQVKRHLAMEMAKDLEGLHSKQLRLQPHWLENTDHLIYVLRAWLKQHVSQAPSAKQMHQILEAVIQAKPDAQPQFTLGAFSLRRFQDCLYLVDPQKSDPLNKVWSNFPDPIPWGTQTLKVSKQQQGMNIPKNSQIMLKTRSGGERIYWRGQNRSVKKLLQTWQIPPWERPHIPLLYVNDELWAIIGFAMSDSCLSNAGIEGYTIHIDDVG